MNAMLKKHASLLGGSYMLRRKAKIDFAIIGFPKCATTSIHKNLHRCHDEIWIHDYEVQVKDLCLGKTRLEPHGKMCGIKNPNLVYEDVAFRTLTKANPEAKYIVCFRDPTRWLFSFYQYRRWELRENKAWLLPRLEREPGLRDVTFGDIVDERASLFGASVQAGRFDVHLNKILKYVEPRRVLPIVMEGLASDPTLWYRRIADFLGLQSLDVQSVTKSNVRSSHYEDVEVYRGEMETLDHKYEATRSSIRSMLKSQWNIENTWW